ncbi:multidrug ABC transporter substrate-binding protein [Paracidovorax avenae]|uniref:ABC transporter permease n=1 Tax=Paracidovorax avenae TaxID=80867 RepID=UPI000D177936|nr:ABC transporter permease [Paracidovorax avenae]AVS81352.1 multidrug ABC transporter substrate-binding protein [Paracidovorax avenae]AVS88615.1 multidrug ABC transporter substrate-binding protein [Paracidovorax avenae]AVS90871.1 multidrug ABC transporter substrate-binding protein [Paracidovorax avenae]AVS99126.1 multidrug ABC transporter substrate-binding protein [Paracidovorax avenae]AVT06127.1 multidrug ABC transporter substrate-binding protein [Paracidovorax avenae]
MSAAARAGELLRLSWRYLWSRPLASALNLLLLTLGLAAVVLVLLVSEQVDRGFERDVQGIDLVVGAKGSPLQLILAGVFHIDVPPGNIALQDFEALQRNPLVAQAIPLSLGDSFAGYRIVGTTPEYPAHYGAAWAAGRVWSRPMEAVLGATVAGAMRRAAGDAGRSLGGGAGGLLGQSFVGTHGLAPGGEAHGDNPYTVVGVLQSCGCVLDRLVLTATESVWKVHESAQADDPDDLEVLRQEREVTLALVRYRSPLAAVTLPRAINSGTPMQAASPAVEITRLVGLLGVGADVLRAFGGVLLGVAALSVFIALWNAVRERRADLAMLRMLGAPPARVGGLLLCEALWLALIASLLGLACGHLLAEGVGRLLAARNAMSVTGWVWLPGEWAVPALAAALAVLAALLPALQAYRVDAGELLGRP